VRVRGNVNHRLIRPKTNNLHLLLFSAAKWLMAR
jgi:hypothetical protein